MAMAGPRLMAGLQRLQVQARSPQPPQQGQSKERCRLGGQRKPLPSGSDARQRPQPRLTCPAPPLLRGRADLGLAVPSTFQVFTSWDSRSEDLC